MSKKGDQANAILTELAARYIARESNRDALITPTRAHIAPDRTKATVFVSVFPDDAVDRALAFLHRHERSFYDFLKRESRFAVLPRTTFEFDHGERHRQHLDEVSKDL